MAAGRRAQRRPPLQQRAPRRTPLLTSKATRFGESSSTERRSAAKALRKFGGPHLPASLAELVRGGQTRTANAETAERAALDATLDVRAKPASRARRT